VSQALLYVTHFTSDALIARFNQIDVTPDTDKILCIDESNIDCVQSLPCAYHTFSLAELRTKGFHPIRPGCLVPGSNHFPIIDFASRHPEYHYVWAVEYDVHFTGSWSTLMNAVSPDVDFVTTRLRRRSSKPRWRWWRPLRGLPSPCEGRSEELIASFNPIYRLSHQAALYLRSACLSRCRGHHEVTMPTLLHRAGYTIEELGGDGEFTPPARRGRFYGNGGTFRWRPTITWDPASFAVDTLYHPVKELTV
jgi:hypothetical protein